MIPEPTHEIRAVKALVRSQTPEDAPEPTKPARPSVYRGMGSNVEQWRPLVSQYFNPGDVDTVMCLIGKESGGNTNARNRSSGASGLMQVLPGWASDFGYHPNDLFNPSVNLSISRYLRDNGGWNHWSPYKRGACHDL